MWAVLLTVFLVPVLYCGIEEFKLRRSLHERRPPFTTEAESRQSDE
jgi:hypothetical protein